MLTSESSWSFCVCVCWMALIASWLGSVTVWLDACFIAPMDNSQMCMYCVLQDRIIFRAWKPAENICWIFMSLWQRWNLHLLCRAAWRAEGFELSTTLPTTLSSVEHEDGDNACRYVVEGPTSVFCSHEQGRSCQQGRRGSVLCTRDDFNGFLGVFHDCVPFY